jgi:hypothetical protein
MKTIFNLTVLFLIAFTLSSVSFGIEATPIAFGGLVAASYLLPTAEVGILQFALCPSACAPSLPTNYSGGCGIVSRPGGIKKFAFIKCDYEFTDVADPAEWTTAIANGDVVASGLVLAQKPKGSFTKKRIASCEPEAVVGGEKTVTFQDFNSDTVTPGGAGTLLHDFYNAIQAQTQNYRFAFYTCDGMLYGIIDDFQIEVDEVIEDNNTGNAFIDGVITWNSVTMTTPVKVNLDGIL